MTPDPPEPPVPVVQSFDVEISNSLSNAYMVLLYSYDAVASPAAINLIGGGRAAIGEWNDLGNFEVSEDVSQLWVYSKAYNNQYPDYNDPYYSDATRKAIIEMSDLDGKTAKITSNGSNNATVVIE